MLVSHLWLAFFWILFGLLHSLLAAPAVKRQVRSRFPGMGRYYRLGYNLFAFASLGAVVAYQLQLDTVYLFETTLLTQLLGFAVAGTGALIMAICIRKYFLNLSGLRSLFTEDTLVHEAVTPVLEVSGIHRYVRHPLYLGTFLFIWGWWLLVPQLSFLVAVSIITVYTCIGIRFEEKKLVDEFGVSYLRYREEVPMLLPIRNGKRRLGAS